MCVLTFLQELLDKGLSFSAMKIYLAATSDSNIGFEGVMPDAHPLATCFSKEVHVSIQDYSCILYSHSMEFKFLRFCPLLLHLSRSRGCILFLLQAYTDRTQNVCLCDQLLICFANPARGRALSSTHGNQTTSLGRFFSTLPNN